MPDAQALLSWSGYPDSGSIRDTDGNTWATVGPPLIGGGVCESPGRVVRRSGALAGEAFETWGPKGWEALESACEAHTANGELLVVPHAGDVLSDIQRCLKFMDRWAGHGDGRGIGLLVDPSALITETMLDRVDDHIARMTSALIPREGVAAVVVANPGNRLPQSVWAEVARAAEANGVPRVAAEGA